MKLTKTILAFCLCISLGAAQTAFGAEGAGAAAETAATEEQMAWLDAALAKSAALADYDAVGTMSVTISMPGMGISMGANAWQQFQIKNAGMDSMEALSVQKMDVLGETQETRAFYTGGYYYGEDYGFPMKTAMPADTALERMSGDFYSMLLWASSQEPEGELTAEEQSLKTQLEQAEETSTLTVAPDGDGWVYTYVCSPEYRALISDGETRITVLAMQYYVGADGYIHREKMEVRGSEGEGRDQTDLICYTEVVYQAPGQPVTISLPSTDGYETWN